MPGRRAYVWVLLPTLFAAAPARALDIESYPELGEFIHEFAQQSRYSEPQLRALFARVQIRPKTVEAIERPKEAALPYYEYRKQFLTDEHVERGLKFWAQHAAALKRSEKKYGVAPEIVVAILGVETHYGRNTGGFPVLDALVTLWLNHPPRSDFFRREVMEFLLLARELGGDPLAIKGSYAGAIGMPQFIPSSYRRYAVDGDGDGRRDLSHSAGDAIASVANFLNVHGWAAGEPVVDDIELSGTLYFWIERLGVKPALTVADLSQYGIMPRGGGSPERRAALVAFEGETGPVYRLGYNNFYVITRYNRSKRYAMAVVELAARLRHHRE